MYVGHSQALTHEPSGIDEAAVHTGLRKMGAVIGDETETGCNSVLNPGVLIGMKCLVYPAIAVRKKYYKEGSIIR